MTADSDAKLARKRMRRWIVWLPPALVAVIVGLLLAGLIPRSTPAPVASRSPSSISSQPHACAAADVLAESNLEGATAALAGGIVVTNNGAADCILAGPPQSVELSSGEDGLDVALTTYTGLLVGGPVAPPIVLEPGDKARSFINWTNWCGGELPSLEMQVVLPAGGDPVSIALASGNEPATTPRCDNPAAPSSLGVFAFAPLTN